MDRRHSAACNHGSKTDLVELAIVLILVGAIAAFVEMHRDELEDTAHDAQMEKE